MLFNGATGLAVNVDRCEYLVFVDANECLAKVAIKVTRNRTTKYFSSNLKSRDHPQDVHIA